MHGYTSDQIAKIGEPERLPFQLLWNATCQIRPRPPVESVTGRVGREVIAFTRGETNVIRRYVIPRDPKSESQLRRRRGMRLAAQAWRGLPEPQIEAWNRWAAKRRSGGDGSRGASGQNVFTGAAMTRHMMGLDLPVDAPASGPPPTPLHVVQEPTAGDDSFALRVHHGVKRVAGMRLLVEITDAMPTVRRKPRDPEFRPWSPDDAASFLPLERDGALYVLDGARFAVAPGQRYGVRLTIVDESGVRGKRLTVDFLKPENSEPAQETDTVATATAQLRTQQEPPAVSSLPAAPRPTYPRTDPVQLLRLLIRRHREPQQMRR
jgi:hypothetical protein